MRDDQIAALIRPDRLTALGYNVDENSRYRPRRRAGNGRRGSRKRAYHYRTGLGLPPRVNDRAFSLADDLVIPHPRFGIDRFADGSEQTQRRQVMPQRILFAPFDKSTDRGRGGVQDVDLVAVDHIPKTIKVGIVRRPFVHKDRRTVGQRAVNHIAVTGYPADVGRTPENVVVLEVKYELCGVSGLRKISARRVQNALRLTGRSRCVKYEQRMFRVEFLGRAWDGDSLCEFVPPVVAARHHVYL